MIPFLPEMSGASGLPAMAGGAVLPASAPEGTGLDFAGLLGAAVPQIAPRNSPQPPVSGGPAPVFLPDTGAPAPALTAAPPAALPPGKIMPEPGAILPEPVTQPETLHAAEQSALLPPKVRPGRPIAPSHDAPEAPVGAPMPQSAADAPVAPKGEATEPAPPEPLTAPEDPAAILPDPPVALPAPVAPSAPAPVADTRQSARLQRGLIVPPADRDTAPMPERVTLPLDPTGEAEAPQPAALSPLPAQPTQLSSPLPEAQPPAFAAPPPVPVSAAPVSIDTPRAPTPQQESAIAQVGDLREAMRSARPEMTLRHAEFGFVSLRLEAAGPQDWRAVLASRDPGFVPAIQTALADRAIAAASASADSGQFMGHNGAGQNGTSDQRYGASPNGGQGGLSPYLGQSGGRDGEAAPDHRRPSTAAAMAARGQEQAEGSGNDTRGLFA